MPAKAPDLFEHVRANGLRKRVARTVADAIDKAPGRSQKPPKAVQNVIAQLRATAADLENRVTGGSKKRSSAAKKGARARAKAR